MLSLKVSRILWGIVHTVYSKHNDQNIVSGGRLEEVKNNGKF